MSAPPFLNKSVLVGFQDCRGSFQEPGFPEGGVMWNRRQGTPNRSRGSAGTGAVQHQPADRSHSKPPEDRL